MKESGRSDNDLFTIGGFAVGASGLLTVVVLGGDVWQGLVRIICCGRLIGVEESYYVLSVSLTKPAHKPCNEQTDNDKSCDNDANDNDYIRIISIFDHLSRIVLLVKLVQGDFLLNLGLCACAIVDDHSELADALCFIIDRSIETCEHVVLIQCHGNLVSSRCAYLHNILLVVRVCYAKASDNSALLVLKNNDRCSWAPICKLESATEKILTAFGPDQRQFRLLLTLPICKRKLDRPHKIAFLSNANEVIQWRMLGFQAFGDGLSLIESCVLAFDKHTERVRLAEAFFGQHMVHHHGVFLVIVTRMFVVVIVIVMNTIRRFYSIAIFVYGGSTIGSRTAIFFLVSSSLSTWLNPSFKSPVDNM